MLHIGPVAAGRLVSADPQLRQEFSSRYGVLAFNQADLAAVIESIYGNRKDQVNDLLLLVGSQVHTFKYLLSVYADSWHDGLSGRHERERMAAVFGAHGGCRSESHRRGYATTSLNNKFCMY